MKDFKIRKANPLDAKEIISYVLSNLLHKHEFLFSNA